MTRPSALRREPAPEPAPPTSSAAASPASLRLAVPALTVQLPGGGALHGRSEVLARLRALLAAAREGRGALVLLQGEPGIGKSRLAEQVASEAEARGVTVAWGRAWEAGGAPPYWPWTQIFRGLGLPEDPFARELAAAEGAAEERFASFDRVARALRELAEVRPLLLVLDDLHAADLPSLCLLLLLARQLRRSRLLVVGAYRDAELTRTPELLGLLHKLEREAEAFALPRLALADVQAWLSALSGETSAAAARELFELTEGHPLFIVEALRLQSSGVPRGTRPPRLCALLDDRLATLGPELRSLLHVAAVLGRQFGVLELAGVAGVSADECVRALPGAVAACLITTEDAESYRFSHVLLRDRLYGELAPSRRAALHLRAGEWLLGHGAAAERVVHHFFAGGSASAVERVAQVALAAAAAALSRLAFEDAARLGRRALELEGRLPARLAVELRLMVAEALLRLERGGEGRALAAEAAARAEADGAHELLGRAALVFGTELTAGNSDEQLRALLRRALAQLPKGDFALRARLLARLAAALTPPSTAAQLDELRELLRTALAMARRLEEPHTLLYVLHFAATVALLVPEQERLAHLSETIELASALGQRLTLLLSLPGYVTALLARGELSRALAQLPLYDQLLAEFPQPRHRLRRALLDSLLGALRGDVAQLERGSREAQQLAQREGSCHARILWLMHRMALAQLLARPGLLEEGDALLAAFETVPRDAPFGAFVLALLGRRAEAAALLRGLELDVLDVHSPHLLIAAEACLLLQDRALAAQLYPRLAGASDGLRWSFPCALLGMTQRVLGSLALLLGRNADAACHHERALGLCEALQAPLLAEQCRKARDAALASSGASSESPAGLHETPAALGASPLEGAAAALASLRREGEVWSLPSLSGAVLRFKHSKGFEYLRHLLDHPGQSLHVLTLAGAERGGDAGAVLDERAKEQYRRRLEALREQQAEAERFADGARAERAASEIEALAAQLAAAVGLGGRDRRAASDVERIRINVQRRLKDAIERVERADLALGRYLARGIKTGLYCSYVPL